MASLVGFGLLLPVLLLGVLVLAVASVAGGRNEADPDGERPFALYLAAVAFVAVFLSLGAFSTIVGAAVDAGLGDDGPTSIERIEIGNGGFEGGLGAPDPIVPGGFGDERDNERIRTMVVGALILVTAGALFVWHDRRLDDFREAEHGPGWRTSQVSGYLICFLALLTALGAVVTFGYAVFQVAAPGVAGVGEREDGLQPAIVSAVTAIAAGAVFAFHWRRLARRSGSRLAQVVAPLPPPTDVPPPPPPPPTARRERPLRPPST